MNGTDFSVSLANYLVDYYSNKEIDAIAEAMYFALDGIKPTDTIDCIDEDVFQCMLEEYEETGGFFRRYEGIWRKYCIAYD